MANNLINVPESVFNFIDKNGYDAIFYIIEAHTGDDYYLRDALVDDGVLTEQEGNDIFEYSEKTNLKVLLKLVNGVRANVIVKTRVNKKILSEDLVDGLL